jgi:hypothetical protein
LIVFCSGPFWYTQQLYFDSRFRLYVSHGTDTITTQYDTGRTEIPFGTFDVCIWVSPILVQDSPIEDTPHQCSFCGIFAEPLNWAIATTKCTIINKASDYSPLDSNSFWTLNKVSLQYPIRMATHNPYTFHGGEERCTSPISPNRNVQYFVSNKIRESFIAKSVLGNAGSPKTTRTAQQENAVIFPTRSHLQQSVVLVTKSDWIVAYQSTGCPQQCDQAVASRYLLPTSYWLWGQSTGFRQQAHLTVAARFLLLTSNWVTFQCTGCRQQVHMTVATWYVLLSSHLLQTCQSAVICNKIPFVLFVFVSIDE